MPCLAARRPHHDHHPAAQVSGCDDPLLTVVSAIIDLVEASAAEHFGGIREIQPSLFQARSRFSGSKLIFIQQFMYPPKMAARQSPGFAKTAPRPAPAHRG
jgi:hypothetical protein